MSICVISQPRFFPGLHYLHRMMVADIFVILDTVQYTPRHEENRAKLKTPHGTQWLTVPVQKASRGQLVMDTLVNNLQPWQNKATKTIQSLYGRAPLFEEFSAEIMAIINTPIERLAQLDYATWAPALRRLGITCEFVYASELPVRSCGSELLLDICTHLGAKTYLSGAFGQKYLEYQAFATQGVDICFHEYHYPTYPQRFDGEFVGYLSYLDMLFNVGLDREHVMAGGQILAPAEV